MATSETWRDKQSGDKKERTEWHRVVVFNDKLAEIAERYIKKGSKLCIEGQLQTRKWTDQSNIEKYTTEVVISRFKGDITLLDSKSDGNRGGGYDGGANFGSDMGSYADVDNKSVSHLEKDLDDEIPF